MKINVQKEIARRKEQFRAANAAEKRVLIAQDVIEQIKSRKLKATKGKYFNFSWKNLDSVTGESSIQKLFLQEKMDRCECCALGGMMLSCTLFKNQEKIIDLTDDFTYLGDAIDEDRKLKNNFNRLFLKDQLILIEAAYERGHGRFPTWYLDLDKQFDYHAAIKFGMTRKSDRGRLIAIMENIIKNKGTFKP